MPHLFYPIDEAFFNQQIAPILARCRRERSFAAARPHFAELLPRVARVPQFVSRPGGAIAGRAGGRARSHLFPGRLRAVVGEVLLFAADDLPLLRLSHQSLCCLLAAAAPDTPRQQYAPIQQVLHGSQDLVFAGTSYRPDFAGYNDRNDVARLADYLQAVDPGLWQPDQLMALSEMPNDEERAEELEFVRQDWPELVRLYEQATARRQILVCEND